MNEIEELLNWIKYNDSIPKTIVWKLFIHDMEIAVKRKSYATLAEFFFNTKTNYPAQHRPIGYFFEKLIEVENLPEKLRQSIGHILLMNEL